MEALLYLERIPEKPIDVNSDYTREFGRPGVNECRRYTPIEATSVAKSVVS
jgi:hypothetical protein